MNSIVVSSITVKRLISDIKEIKKNPLSKEGIYYKHDESDMLYGYALIIGPENTPYAHGYFLFKFNFPYDYPHSPPTVTYHTNDGYTRFHPNFYKNGKVCVSILNTWKGEQWTGCQTIRSILLSLCSLFNENPLINEPGIVTTHKDIIPYNKIIKYKTISIAINKILTKDLLYFPKYFEVFNDEIINNFIKNYDKIKKTIENELKNLEDNKIINSITYGLSIKINYDKQNKILQSHYDTLSKNDLSL